MRHFLENGAFLFIATALTVAGTPSRADELLVMRYSCSVVAGQLVLTPSQDEGHRILGQREQRHFTACSPVNPDMCRHWTVHRFDLDCGGTRVPWVSVVAAAGEARNARAWVEDGRLRVRVGPWWTTAPGDPCARLSGYEDRWQTGGLARHCAERRTLAPPPTVEMPTGFAPMLGIDGIFVAATAPKPSTGPAAPPSIAAIPAPHRVARAEPAPAPRSEAIPPEATAKETPAKSRPAPEVNTQPRSLALAAPQPPAQTPGTPDKPRIINQIEPAPGNAPRQEPRATALPETPAATTEAIPRFGANRPELSTTPQAGRSPDTEDNSIAVTLISTVRNPSTIAAVALGGLAVLLIAAMAAIRGRERAQLAAATFRDFAAVSLPGHDGRENLPAARAIVGADARQPSLIDRAHPSWPAQPQSGGVPPSWGDEIPRTRDDALRVLGIGVTPDASEIAIKKIVDGLRLSWHPDHANDAADRLIRELRLKQINCAWDIIAGKRVEA
jgi:hypothetical protein